MQNYESHFPNFTTLVDSSLIACGSNAGAERLFSETKDLTSGKRSTTGAALVDMTMVVSTHSKGKPFPSDLLGKLKPSQDEEKET